MPRKISNFQNWVKITVWFKSGTKPYRMDVSKKAEFMRNLKKRKDVIKYTTEAYRVYIS